MNHFTKALRNLWLPALIAGIGFLMMAVTLLRALAYGHLTTEGRLLLEMPWGLMTLVDIYIGLLLFACWIFWREWHVSVSMFWLLLLMLFGNLASCLYILIAVLLSRGNIDQFIHGRRASGIELDTTRQIYRVPEITDAHKQ
jgi:hypothetical protein